MFSSLPHLGQLEPDSQQPFLLLFYYCPHYNFLRASALVQAIENEQVYKKTNEWSTNPQVHDLCKMRDLAP